MRPKVLKRGFSLVELLVVVAIIAILAAFLLPHYLGGAKDAAGKTIQSPKQRAEAVDCWNNQNQLRQAYQLATSTDESKPTSLADLQRAGHLPDSMMYCPVGGKQYPYHFDPATGTVSCTYPPHQGTPH
jgi:prepilin-type N-terminal cleavage/methylation domain-containing protein